MSKHRWNCPVQGRCIRLANGGTLRWHTHLSPDHSIGKDYAKMKAESCKIVENTLEGSRAQEKTMEDEAAQAKSEGQHIHGAFHTRQVHTFCKWGAHEDGTHTSFQTIEIGEDYAKMKAGPCKIVENTLEDSRKKHMEQHNPRVKVKTYMEFSNTRQVHTSCKWGGCHTKMAHHAFNRCGG